MGGEEGVEEVFAVFVVVVIVALASMVSVPFAPSFSSLTRFDEAPGASAAASLSPVPPPTAAAAVKILARLDEGFFDDTAPSAWPPLPLTTKASASSLVVNALNDAPLKPVTDRWHSSHERKTPVALPAATA